MKNWLSRRGRGSIRWPWPICVVACAVLLMIVFYGGWMISGGQVYTMTTASMSPVTPVGSLLLDRRPPANLRVGDTITFHPNTEQASTYSHRIVQVLPNGRYRTQGWANPQPDAWVVSRHQIVGQVVAQVWGLGWLFKALPFLAVGLLLFAILYPSTRREHRFNFTIGWLLMMVIVPLLILKPLSRVTILSTTAANNGAALRVHMINTGLLPGLDHIHGGASKLVAPGQSAWLSGHVKANQVIQVYQQVSLPWWGWAIVALLIVSPLLALLAEDWLLRHDPLPGGDDENIPVEGGSNSDENNVPARHKEMILESNRLTPVGTIATVS